MKAFFASLTTERGRRVAPAMLFAGLSAGFLFGGYEFIRSSAESIFIGRFGADAKPYAMSCVPFLMALLIYLYGRLLSAVGGKKAMAVSMLASSAFFLLAFLGLRAGAGGPLIFLLYVFKESYVVVIAEQYWSFINSTLREEEGRAYNGPVAGVGAIGPLTAGWLVERFAVSLHTDFFVLLSGLAMLPALWLFWLAYSRAGEPEPAPEEAHGRKGHLHLSILKENRTVLCIALVVFATQVVATMLELRFAQLAQAAFPGLDQRTAFFGGFWMKVNMFSFTMQFLLTPLLLRYLPIRRIQTAIPAVHLVTLGALLFYPRLFIAALAFLLFKGLDYSLFRASKETLYIPFSYDTRYRAKQVAEAFTYRFSKGLTAALVSLARAAGELPAGAYPGTAFLFALGWMGAAFPMTAARGASPAGGPRA